MPGKSGAYDISEVIIWQRKTIATLSKLKPIDTTPSGNGQAVNDDTKAELERQQLRVDIAMKKLRHAALQDELVDRAAAKAAVTKLFHSVRGRLEAVPDEMVAVLPGEFRNDALADWRNQIQILLKELETPSQIEAGGTKG